VHKYPSRDSTVFKRLETDDEFRARVMREVPHEFSGYYGYRRSTVRDMKN
jgi:hypothetical protein